MLLTNHLFSCRPPLFALLLWIAVAGCDQPQNNLLSQVTTDTDSLFYDIRFGMTQAAFYDYCLAMNQKGLFFQGTEGVRVKCLLEKGFTNKVAFNFFPTFVDKQVQQVKGTFTYADWRPFQPQFASTALLGELTGFFEKAYGGKPFTQHADSSLLVKTVLKIDGKRQITLRETIDSRSVDVVFEKLP